MLRKLFVTSSALAAAAVIASSLAHGEQPASRKKSDGSGVRSPAVQKIREPLRPSSQNTQAGKGDKGVAWVSGTGGTRGYSKSSKGKKSR